MLSEILICGMLAFSKFKYLFLYLLQVVGFGRMPKIVSPWENLCLISFLVGAFYSAYSVRSRALESSGSMEGGMPEAAAPGGLFATRYCRVCTTTVPHKEHHCVWLDVCVSFGNFYPFVAFLFCIFVTLIHSGLLFLTSVCDSIRDFRYIVLVWDIGTVWFHHNHESDTIFTSF